MEDEIDRDKEHFWAIGLNTKNVVLYVELVSLGTINSNLVHPREVFRMAIFKAAAQIIVGHNHPSGALEVSTEDKRVTERLRSAGDILGINLLDHIVIANGNPEHFSFQFHSTLLLGKGREMYIKKPADISMAQGNKKKSTQENPGLRLHGPQRQVNI
jgi:DNA repair protein RadC